MEQPALAPSPLLSALPPRSVSHRRVLLPLLLLLQALGFDLRSSSLLSFLPWLVMACGSSLAGVLAGERWFA